MNTRPLLRHFERVSEAPGSAAELRSLVVCLAVHGKLVPHESAGPAAADLHRSVQRGIERLSSKTRRCRWSKSDPIGPSEANLKLPPFWTWARLNDTGLYINGIAFKPADWKKDGRPIIRIQNLSDEAKEFNFVTGEFPDENVVRDGDLLVSWSATLDAFVWRRGEGVLNQHIFKVIVNSEAVTRDYLYWLLKHEIRVLAESDHAHGLAMKHINRGPFLSHVVPLPPLPEQHRIVAKVDELMALCDRLEAAQAERESRRDRLVASSLSRLSEAAGDDAKNFRDHARFHLDHLPRLASRAEHVAQLRRAIVDLAVRGQLVPQDPTEEPVLKLFDRIRAEKAQLMQRKETPKESPLPPVGECDRPFEIPESWRWSRAYEISTRISDGVHKKPNYVETGIPFITVKNLTEGPGISFRDTKFITRSDHDEFVKRTHPERGDVLITKDGTIGVARVIETDREFSIFVSVALVKLVEAGISAFFALCINSEVIRSVIVPKGAALKHLHLVDLRALPIPLPPLAEQHRIIAKVDQLMTLCDQLEAQLTTTQTESRRLLEAVLHEALAPAA